MTSEVSPSPTGPSPRPPSATPPRPNNTRPNTLPPFSHSTFALSLLHPTTSMEHRKHSSSLSSSSSSSSASSTFSHSSSHSSASSTRSRSPSPTPKYEVFIPRSTYKPPPPISKVKQWWLWYESTFTMCCLELVSLPSPTHLRDRASSVRRRLRCASGRCLR